METGKGETGCGMRCGERPNFETTWYKRTLGRVCGCNAGYLCRHQRWAKRCWVGELWRRCVRCVQNNPWVRTRTYRRVQLVASRFRDMTLTIPRLFECGPRARSRSCPETRGCGACCTSPPSVANTQSCKVGTVAVVVARVLACTGRITPLAKPMCVTQARSRRLVALAMAAARVDGVAGRDAICAGAA